MVELLPEIEKFLQCGTPKEWIAEAIKLENLEILLIDHANCEKKAAFTALNLMMKYTELEELQHKMSRLAREELRHFEQVAAIMKQRKVAYIYLEASKYAERLRKHLRKTAKERLVDILIIGAYIEARSCERFFRVAPFLDKELHAFYMMLIKSEGRHYQDYLKLAEKYADASIDARVAFFGEVEKEAILAEDPIFRFHSGIPMLS